MLVTLPPRPNFVTVTDSVSGHHILERLAEPKELWF